MRKSAVETRRDRPRDHSPAMPDAVRGGEERRNLRPHDRDGNDGNDGNDAMLAHAQARVVRAGRVGRRAGNPGAATRARVARAPSRKARATCSTVQIGSASSAGGRGVDRGCMPGTVWRRPGGAAAAPGCGEKCAAPAATRATGASSLQVTRSREQPWARAISSRSRARTRAGAAAGGSGRPRASACSRSTSRSGRG